MTGEHKEQGGIARQIIKKPKTAEINQLTMKLIVGVIAVVIASATSFVSTLDRPPTSISESYFAGDCSRNIFVGFLFAISAFLLSYNGQTRAHMVLSRVAALAGLGVAMFPCKCHGGEEIIPYVHYVSAVVMFAVLAYFCIEFYRHARSKGHRLAGVPRSIWPASGRWSSPWSRSSSMACGARSWKSKRTYRASSSMARPWRCLRSGSAGWSPVEYFRF